MDVGLADRGRAGRDANDPALRAGHRAQVLAVTLREHHLDVLRVAAARSAVERLGDLAVVEHDLAAGLGHRAIRQRVLRAHSAVSLAARRRAEVEPFVDEAAELAHGVGARRHRLRLERIQAVVELGAHLDRHHAAQIVLERQLVDQVEQPAIVEIDQDAAAESPAIEPHARLRVGLDHQPTTLRLARGARRRRPRAPERRARGRRPRPRPRCRRCPDRPGAGRDDRRRRASRSGRVARDRATRTTSKLTCAGAPVERSSERASTRA